MNDNDSTPVMYDHCCSVYNYMAADVKIQTVEGVRIGVWEGYLTRLIQNDLGLAVPYYSAIRAHLIRMGCIRQMRRGGGSSMSQWEVIKPPTRELFENAEETGGQRRQRKETQKQQINDLSKRITKLEDNEKAFMVALANLQSQLTAHVSTRGSHEEVA